MRISDLLPSGKERQAPFTPLMSRFTASEETPAAASDLSPIASAQIPEPEASAAEAYGNLVQVSRRILNGLAEIPAQTPDLEAACEAVDQIMGMLAWKRAQILEFLERSTPEDYLIAHSANVTVLALAVSQQLGWPEETRRALGVGCLLHDAGLLFHKELCQKARTLTQDERLALNGHVAQGGELLSGFFEGLSESAKAVVQNVVLQCQERNSGQGFPGHLSQPGISPEARLAGLCDTYESFTHPRPWRARKLPADALKHLLEFSGEYFDGALIKALRETLTLYPPGSFVKLTSGEVAKVVDLNRRLPVRPVVQVIVNADGTATRREKRIDLSERQDVSIDRPVDECQLHLDDAGLLLELRARRWWLG